MTRSRRDPSEGNPMAGIGCLTQEAAAITRRTRLDADLAAQEAAEASANPLKERLRADLKADLASLDERMARSTAGALRDAHANAEVPDSVRTALSAALDAFSEGPEAVPETLGSNRPQGCQVPGCDQQAVRLLYRDALGCCLWLCEAHDPPHAQHLEGVEAQLRDHAEQLQAALFARVLGPGRYIVRTRAPYLLGHEPLDGLRRLVRQVGGEVLDVQPDALLCDISWAARAQLSGCAAAFQITLERDAVHEPLGSDGAGS